jgi:hypothetical protein
MVLKSSKLVNFILLILLILGWALLVSLAIWLHNADTHTQHGSEDDDGVGEATLLIPCSHYGVT